MQALSSSKTGATERCTFEVSNKDNERIDATIWLGQVDGLTVPMRLDLAGAIEGTLKLNTTQASRGLRNSRRADGARRLDSSDLEPAVFLSLAPHRIETPDARALRRDVQERKAEHDREFAAVEHRVQRCVPCAIQ